MTTEKSQRFTWSLLSIGLLQLCVVIAYRNGLNHDVAMLVTMSDMLLKGALPMRDMLDTNPPTVVYLGVVPVLLRDWVGFDIVRATHVGVTLFLGLTGGLSVYLLGRVLPGHQRGLRIVLATVWMYLAAVVLWDWEYGQRDQLIAAAVLPYVFLRVVQLRGERPHLFLQSLAALLLATALLMKPMYLTVPFLIEAWLLLRLRWQGYARLLSPVLMTFLLLALLLVLVGSVRTYFLEWFPLMTDYHKTMGYGFKAGVFRMLRLEYFHYSVFLLAFSWVLQRSLRKSPLRDILAALSLLYVAVMLTMLSQGKGWDYHVLPMRMTIWLLAGLSLYALLSSVIRDRWLQRHAVLLCVGVFTFLQLALYPSITSWPRSHAPRAPGNSLSAAIKRYSRPGDYVAAIGANAHTQFPAITYTGRRYGSRYYYSFPVIMCYSGQDSISVIPGREWFEQKYIREFAEDLRRYKPKVLLIEVRDKSWAFPEGFDIQVWLRMHNFFEKAGKPYHLAEYLPEHFMQVYVRD